MPEPRFTSFFWAAQTANTITLIVSLAALLIVIWLGPRRWTNLSFALLLASICLWMGPSAIARLLVNAPEIGGDPQLWLNLLSLGFGLVGITLFWFVESFDPLPAHWRRLTNTVGLLVYALFAFGLTQGWIIGEPRRDSNGGISFTIFPLGTALSAFHYIYDLLAIAVLLRRGMWRRHWHLLVGTTIVVATSFIALLFPAIPLQTFTIAVGALFMVYELVRQQVINPLLQVNQRLEAEVASRTAALADSLAEQERVRSELAIARAIQTSLLPRVTPAVPQITIAGRSLPAQEVGGDFYAYHQFADGRLGVAIGDVSGKGIPAALLMAFSLRTYELLADRYPDQGDLLTACNAALAPRLTQSAMQSAFLLAAIDRSSLQVALANAGMIAPLLWRDGAVQYIDSTGLPLGSLADARYRSCVIAWEPGDMLLLISDGVVEAMNDARDLWGFNRLEAIFAAIGAEEPAVVVEKIFAEVRSFAGGASPQDDMTIVALRLAESKGSAGRGGD